MASEKADVCPLCGLSTKAHWVWCPTLKGPTLVPPDAFSSPWKKALEAVRAEVEKGDKDEA